MNQEDKRRALETAVASIEKDYGKGSIMRLGDNTAMNIETIPTGSIFRHPRPCDMRHVEPAPGAQVQVVNPNEH